MLDETEIASGIRNFALGFSYLCMYLVIYSKIKLRIRVCSTRYYHGYLCLTSRLFVLFRSSAS